MSSNASANPEDHVLKRVRAEFLEMPGLRLTRQQAQRLWGLDGETCANLLAVLVYGMFLCFGSDGYYGRLAEGPFRANA